MEENKTDKFQETIKAYLDKMAQNDATFAVTYAKENKSIEECCEWIIQEVSRMPRSHNCVALSDEEVFGMAVHYYDEDECKVEKPKPYTPEPPKPKIVQGTLFDMMNDDAEETEDDTEE